MGGQERSGQDGQLAPLREPAPQRQCFPLELDVLTALKFQTIEDFIDQRTGLDGDDAEGVAGLVTQAGILDQQLKMADVAVPVSPSDALIDQNLRGKRVARV